MPRKMDSRSNILQLCRLCLVKEQVNIDIFNEHGEDRQIFQKISSCLPVKVSQNDKLPKRICDGCSYKLDMCYEFCNLTVKAEQQLLKWLEDLPATEKSNDVQNNVAPNNAKPTEAIVKEEQIDPSDVHKEEDDKDYVFAEKVEENNAGPSATVTQEDEPPPKRQRRTAAVKAAIAMDHDSDDDDDSGEPLTKMEDESDDSDGEDNDPSFADIPSTSADDQPGPSGVGKEAADAPPKKKIRRKTRKPTTRKKKKDPNFDPDDEEDSKTGILKEANKPSKPAKKRKEPADEADKAEACNRKLLRPVYMKTFCNATEPEKPIPCQHCDKVFDTNLEFGLHSKTHDKDGKYSCHLCNFEHVAKIVFRGHVRSHDEFQCRTCKHVVRNKYRFYDHWRSHQTQEYVKCEICGKDVRTAYISKHRKLVHEPKPLLFACTICNKAYKYGKTLKEHYSHNHKELGIDTSVICDTCGARLSTKTKLAKHMMTHTGVRPFACSFCPKRFITNDQLLAHNRVHTGEKPYACKYCGKRFAHGAPFRYHIRTHTGEKLCNCPFCGKGFITKANMRVHLNSCMMKVK